MSGITLLLLDRLLLGVVQVQGLRQVVVFLRGAIVVVVRGLHGAVADVPVEWDTPL
jgi:hypothetical protein